MGGGGRPLHRSIGRSMSAVMVLAVATVGCTDDGGSTVGTPGATVAVTPSAPTDTRRAEPATTPAVPSTAGITDVTVVSSTDAIVAIPDDVVPGIDSDDPFCRAWCEFAGSFQALAGVESAAASLEVTASAAVSSAARTIADEFPVPIAFERDVFVNDVIGPFARRADRASDALRVAGLSPAEVELLGELWLGALTDAGIDEPRIEVAVPADLVDAVAAAVAEFSSNVPAIAQDPSLVTQASTPTTFEFLAANCPDQGILAGNDAID